MSPGLKPGSKDILPSTVTLYGPSRDLCAPKILERHSGLPGMCRVYGKLTRDRPAHTTQGRHSLGLLNCWSRDSFELGSCPRNTRANQDVEFRETTIVSRAWGRAWRRRGSPEMDRQAYPQTTAARVCR